MFEKLWNARLILNDIERLNPNFYPKPIREVSGSKPGAKSDLKDITEGYLTKDKFLKVYEKCGKIMHADNPYGAQTDYGYYERSIPLWMEEIRVLLNSHTIRLINDENM
jgi:hypothetical protein